MPIKPRTFQTAKFAGRLQKVMILKGLSQSEVARELGYTPTGVWNWLQGNTFPRQETLAQLSALLDVDEEWLREGDPMPAVDGDDPSGDGAGKESIARRIEELRSEISALLGCELSRVKLSFEIETS